ncbi:MULTISPECIES: efflux RND transporter periplasmic adaptor subunit [Gammaproteobacteria]|uniref:efflux RND transporter periplasmic adaptor subunit n=1 Tax=Gammaproteobacteria TaxID=1236 RepID=UPI000DD041B5|nr:MULTISPECIES: efflux RND transporter periplasmic adaptor subunit [Gammaproteobacteria]RTE85706.1 efflux RND transporter periplasmic adaptor subunit [Aliidiomarina sp. B3213]TCZ90294.1 efflux RND transporter periplasmic adaptor subunit [Lysobacter sp. N42]
MAKKALFTPLSIFAVLLIAVIVWLYLGGKDSETGQHEMPKPNVVVDSPQMLEFRDVINGLGTAKASESVNLMARVTQTVREIYFQDGQEVNKGDMLIALNDREERARVQELEFRLTEQTRQLNRLRELARGNAASRSMLDEQEVLVEQTSAELEVARSRLAEMTIYAPFAGRVGLREVSIGSLVRPGDVITTLDALDPIYVDFSVPEVYLPSLLPGQRVGAKSAAYEQRIFEGEIVSLASRVDPVTRSIQVRAAIDNESRELRPGMLLQVELERNVEQVLMVPESAVVPVRASHYVYALDSENRVVMTEVEVGRRQPGWVEVLSGVTTDDIIVVEGTVRVRDGLPVNPTER